MGALAPGILSSEFETWPPDTDGMVRIVVGQLRGWFLVHAQSLLDPPSEHGAFASLAIVASYFETMGRLYPGAKRLKTAEKRFWRGMQVIFPTLRLDAIRLEANTGDPEIDALVEEAVTILEEDLRHGLYHQTMTGSRLSIGRREGTGAILEVALHYAYEPRKVGAVRRLLLCSDELKTLPVFQPLMTPLPDAVPHVLLDPHELVPALRRHLDQYEKQLEINAELRDALTTAFVAIDQRNAFNQMVSTARLAKTIAAAQARTGRT